MTRKGYDKRDFKKLGRLKGESAGKPKPRLVVGTGRGIADKKGKPNQNDGNAGDNKFMLGNGFVIDKARKQNDQNKSADKSDKLNKKLFKATGVSGGGHNHYASKKGGEYANRK